VSPSAGQKKKKPPGRLARVVLKSRLPGRKAADSSAAPGSGTARHVKIVAKDARSAADNGTGKSTAAGDFRYDCATKGTSGTPFDIILKTPCKDCCKKRHDEKGLFPHVTLPLVMVFIDADSTAFRVR
jgi:hypothetical protein